MIDTVNATSAASTTPSTGSATDQAMGKDEFLRLLVTQLSNQDPLNPMDGQQFAAQLAQFTSVEQLTNINGTLEGQQEMYGLLSQNVNSGVAAGLLGRQVEADSNTVTWTSGGDPIDLGFRLPERAEEVAITIRNEAGATVRTLKLEAHDAGAHLAEWDGTDTSGSAVSDGTYTFSIDAIDKDGVAVSSTPYVTGRVDRVTFGQDGIQLWVGGTKLPMGAINSVSEGAPE